jgi:F5/8 type C domain
MTNDATSLDDFRDISPWIAVASGVAQLALRGDAGPDGHAALRLDYDFKTGGGFVVARRNLARAMPAVWAISLRVRGAAPANKFEIKLADPSNRNVWWWRRDAFDFPADWQMLRIRSSEVSFAWGPAGGGTIEQLGALELAIAAGPGGRGTVWVADLRFEDLSLAGPPRVTASSAQPGHEPERALDPSPATWHSVAAEASTWFALDFGREHEYGGLIVDWAGAGAPRSFDVECSDDGASWRTLARATQAEGERSYVYLPGGGCSRHLRLSLHERAAGGGPLGIRTLDVRPFDFSRSLGDFFHAVAACEPRGHHPRWLHREQSYWTPVGIAGGTTAAILNEEGMLEPDRASFSLEPFLYATELITWADAEIAVSLAHDSLPIPSSTWRRGELALTVSAFAAVESGRAEARALYRISNHGGVPCGVRFFVAMRPFQVSPPWQSFQGIGGAAEIHSIVWRDGAVVVNGEIRVVPRTAPHGFGAAAFEQGGVLRHLEQGTLPPHTEIVDAFRHASGALRWDIEVAPGGTCEVELAIPFAQRPALGPVSIATTRDAGVASLHEAERHWQRKLGRVRIEIGSDNAACIGTLQTATGHILVNRDGPAIQPGPRRYTRSWIRDGATMSAALLRMGCVDEVRDFLAWYATYQAGDGNVPCAVDRNGADWLPEHDSHGQFVFTLVEYFRFTGDSSFAAALWPAAQRAIGYLNALLSTRRTQEFRTAQRRACFGILPESASHEGYLAQPVHAYWDDFWALRGIGDAAELARALGDAGEAMRIGELRDELRKCLYESIDATIADRGLAYIPGSVEWADFDPTATATAIATTDAAERLPPGALAWTFDEYLRGLRKRRRGEIDWNNYSAYEIRILGALLRLGRRADAHELLEFFLGDRRPLAWNQWPEISWRDPRSPGHLGDVPHAWIGAEYVLAVLGMFAYERPADAALVIAAGISEPWLASGTVVDGLPTWWGPLGYSLRRDGPDALRFELAPGLAVPPGGIVVRPPLARPLAAVEVDGAPQSSFDSDGVTLHRWPASIVMRF